MATSAQCAGKERVIAMFENRGLQAWSIWLGKQFLFTGMGSDELEEILEMMADGSNSVYTLRVYKGITNSDDITEKTPASGSFNFYVKEKSEVATRENAPQRTLGAVHRMIEERVAEEIISALDKGNERPRKQEIGDILQDPEQIKEWVGVLGLVKDLFANKQQAPPMQLANVGNPTIVTDQPEVEKEYSPEDQMRLITAINQLQKNDPKILDHLEKLAKISTTSPAMFKNLLTMLDAMP